MLTSHPVSYCSPCDVSSWAAHVHASSLIPPPPPVVPSTSSTSTSTTVAGAHIHQDGCDRLLHFRMDIPKPVCNVISRHLQLTIGNWDTTSLLGSLPHPIRNPLVCSMLLRLHSSVIHVSYICRNLHAIPMCAQSQINMAMFCTLGICTGFSKSCLK